MITQRKKKGTNKVELTVKDYEIIRQTFSTKTVYKFDVTTEDGKHYEIGRSYKEVKDLHNQLSKLLSTEMPPLPPHRSFGRKTVAKFKEKVSELNDYVTTLTNIPGATTSREFVTFCIPRKQDLRSSLSQKNNENENSEKSEKTDL